MKRIAFALIYVALLGATAFTCYTWGWYSGLSYHSVVSGMSEAKWSLSAARSLRQSDPALALELLEANISWADMALGDVIAEVPDEQRPNYALVMRHLKDYKDRYWVIDLP